MDRDVDVEDVVIIDLVVVLALSGDPGIVVVELFLDDDLCRPIQSELVSANIGVFFSAFGHRPFLMAAIRKPFSFSTVVRCLEKLWNLFLLKLVRT